MDGQHDDEIPDKEEDIKRVSKEARIKDEIDRSLFFLSKIIYHSFRSNQNHSEDSDLELKENKKNSSNEEFT